MSIGYRPMFGLNSLSNGYQTAAPLKQSTPYFSGSSSTGNPEIEEVVRNLFARDLSGLLVDNSNGKKTIISDAIPGATVCFSYTKQDTIKFVKGEVLEGQVLIDRPQFGETEVVTADGENNSFILTPKTRIQLTPIKDSNIFSLEDVTQTQFENLLRDVRPGQRITIGRAPGGHMETPFEVPWLFVSREHCQLRRMEKGQYEIKDLGSKNGTYITRNGEISPTKVEFGLRLVIGPGDKIHFLSPTHPNFLTLTIPES